MASSHFSVEIARSGLFVSLFLRRPELEYLLGTPKGTYKEQGLRV